MPKRSRNPKVSFSLDNLYLSVFSDVSQYLSNEVAGALALSYSENGLQAVAHHLEELVSDAEKLTHRDYQSYAALRQLDALFSKNASMPGTDSASRKEAAIQKFLESEKTCKETNRRLAFPTSSPDFTPQVKSVMDEAKWIIYNLLGPLPDPSILWKECSFGPGITFGAGSQEHANLVYKIGGPHTVTSRCLPFVGSRSFTESWPLWLQTLVSENATYTIVKGNRITTVPKTAVIDRTIAIEPSFSVFLQKGLEVYLTKRLRRSGVDLRSQGRNQHIARIASTKPLYAATMDLSSASDTIACELVRYLFPSDWFYLLDSLRSEFFTVDKGKSWSRYEKISSMGNAFTFPLETIIFYAIAKASTIVARGDVKRLRVYGDDIIIDFNSYALCAEVLDFAGFSVNHSKSFAIGSFRETCGVDYLCGRDTRPVYVRKAPRYVSEVFNLFNRLLNNRVGLRLDRTLCFLHGLVKRPLYGPPILPPKEHYADWYAGKAIEFDSYFHAPVEMVERFKRFDPGLQTDVWEVLALRREPKGLDDPDLPASYQYLAFLRGLREGRTNSLVLHGYRLRKVSYTFWDERPWWPSCFYPQN